MAEITSLDIRILFFLHQLAGPHMDLFITGLTTVINCFWLWLIAAAVGIRIPSTRRLTLTVILAVAISIFVGDITLKHMVMRLRPYLVIPDAPTLSALTYPVTNSFPSGHSFFFFAGATVFFRFRRPLGLLAYLVAIVVAFSRMYLFMHFPSDVATGAILGIVIGNLAYVLEPKLQLAFTRKLLRKNV